jgi:hypothetical protein
MLIVWYRRKNIYIPVIGALIGLGVCAGLFGALSAMTLLAAVIGTLVVVWYARTYRIARQQVLDLPMRDGIYIGACMAGLLSMFILTAYALPLLQSLMLALIAISMLSWGDAAGWDRPVYMMGLHHIHVLKGGKYGWAILGCALLALGWLGVWGAGMAHLMNLSIALACIPLVVWWYVISWHRAPFSPIRIVE